MRLFILISWCAVTIGCVNDRLGPRLASWQGSQFNDVAAAWGPPAECSADEAQRLCAWHLRTRAEGEASPSVGRTSCTTMLAFDAKGLVTGWRWRGDRCQDFASVVALNIPAARPAALRIENTDESAGGAVSNR